MRSRTKEIFDGLGLKTDPDAVMENLSVSERQMAEIAKAVSYDARIIVFDEPTSSLTESEAQRLFGIIETLKKRGAGIIYISHKMSEILKIADRITVMRDGRYIATENKENMTVEKIIRLMVGRELSNIYPERDRNIGEALLTAQNLTGEYSVLKNASLTLRRGEILGVAGLEGSGRTELLSALFGISRLRSGEIYLGGKRVENKSPIEAIRNGFALLTEERRASGIFGILDLMENTTVSCKNKIRTGPFISVKKQKALTEEYMRKMRVKAPGARAKIESLSGGNQQKVILSRWLLTDPSVLLLDEPTRGIDVGAKYEIYSILSKLCRDGMGIIMVSSEMGELLGLCDRIIVMSEGRIAGELECRSATQEKIMELAAKFSDNTPRIG
jgi:methyl-galactoside transport system ATP-binding protein